MCVCFGLRTCTACISVGRLDFPYLCLIFGLVLISCFLLSYMLLICLWEVPLSVMKNVFYYYDYDMNSEEM